MPFSFKHRGTNSWPIADDPQPFSANVPASKTRREKRARLALEADARRVSDEIDAQLRDEKRLMARSVKVLILGKRGSGRTTVLKNLRLTRAPVQWERERGAWCLIIFLNLVRNINIVLDQLAHELSGEGEIVSNKTLAANAQVASQQGLQPIAHASTLLERLKCLGSMQHVLESLIASANLEGYGTTSASRLRTPDTQKSVHGAFSGSCVYYDDWSQALHHLEKEWDNYRATERDFGELLSELKADIKSLWDDGFVGELLARECIQLESSAEYFISNIDRITSQTYQPTDNDILHAWLRTLNPQEHRYASKPGTRYNKCIFYDIGRLQLSGAKASWLSFFEDASCIVFLAPISDIVESCSDNQYAARLEESYNRWESVCSSRLFRGAEFVLIFNKIDILRERSSEKLSQHPASVDTQDDDSLMLVVKDVVRAFVEAAQRGPHMGPRVYVHITSLVDTTDTVKTWTAVEDVILRASLQTTCCF